MQTPRLNLVWLKCLSLRSQELLAVGTTLDLDNLAKLGDKLYQISDNSTLNSAMSACEIGATQESSSTMLATINKLTFKVMELKANNSTLYRNWGRSRNQNRTSYHKFRSSSKSPFHKSADLENGICRHH